MSGQPDIAMIVPYRFVPPFNGGHKAAFGFSDFMAQKAAFVCISTQNNDVEQASFPLLPLLPDGPAKYASPLVLSRLYRYFRQANIRQVILHQHFIGILLMPLILFTSLKFTVYIQNIEYQRFKSMRKWYWPIIYLSEYIVYRLAWRLQFISPDDLPIAVTQFGINTKKCGVTPYGTYRKKSPDPAELSEARALINEKHGYAPNEKLIIFFGPQTYQPNLEAVDRILDHINPWLQKHLGIPYRILICGGGLPKSYNRLADYQTQHIDYLGFVEDIDLYVKASDLMINPINTGGGVKTKVIEAIGLGKTVVSSFTGSIGVDPSACGDKLLRVADEDYAAFGNTIRSELEKPPHPSPDSFYQTYYWGNTIKSLLEVIK
ncbi:MAG: hypothetical protein DHS20C18_50390 [Saprospiraceae bacterium]|nr:MAG: hypothetical protein DHS20C18_50390 [Saprospiraceae bacterium]